MSMYQLGQSMFPQRQDKDQQLGHSLYTPGGGAQTNLYGSAIPTGLSTGLQGLSIHPPGSRALASASQYGVSRSSTAPAGYGAMTGVGGISQLGAPSPPPTRGGMLPLGTTRTGLMSTGQGLVGAKQSRPSSLSSAIGRKPGNEEGITSEEVGSALPMTAYGSLGRASQGMMSPGSSAYGNAFSDITSQGFDPSDFPSLSSRVRHDSSGGLITSSAALPSRPGYAIHGIRDQRSTMPAAVGQLSKPAESVPGFQIHSEDFPALPGTSNKTSDSSELPQDSKFSGGLPASSLPEPRSSLSYDPAPGSNKERSSSTLPIGPPKGARKSNQASTVSIPPGMVQDQFGMMGLLTFIRGAETDPNLVALALGSDLTTLGLNLNSPESLYNTFASPWADAPCRPQDIDYNVPQEYLIHGYVREKLAPIRLNRYNEDLLFYLYYSNGGDLLQVLAAGELYARDWRYHKEERLWITRAPGMKPTKQESTYEEGTYCYFDVSGWRKAHKEFHVEYDKLEDRPQMPPNILGHQGLTPVPTQA